MTTDLATTVNEGELAPAVWRALTDHFSEAMVVLRHEAPLDGLEAHAWSVLMLVVAGWLRGDGRLSQTELAAHTGCSIRTVRRSLDVLRSTGLVRGVRDNGAVNELEVGAQLAPLLRGFAFLRDPKLWVRPVTMAGVARPQVTVAGVGRPRDMSFELTPATETEVSRPQATVAVVSRPQDTGATRAPSHVGALIPGLSRGIRVAAPTWSPRYGDGVTAAAGSTSGLIKKNKKEDPISSSLKGDPSGPTQASLVDDATSRRLALKALATLHERSNPGIPLPRACHAADVRLVEACAAKGTWDAATLEQTHLDAITGAFERSTSGAPTPMFIWGHFHFFLKNARIGRALRLKPKPMTRPKTAEPDDAPASFDWMVAHLGNAATELETIPSLFSPTPRRRFDARAE